MKLAIGIVCFLACAISGSIDMAAIERTIESKELSNYIKQTDKPKLHSWISFFDTTSLQKGKIVQSGTKRISNACLGDTTKLLALNNGYRIERGAAVEHYYLVDSFPPTPNMLRPGLSKDDVKKIIGDPAFEKKEVLAYKCKEYSSENSYISLFFEKDSLRIIHFLLWKDECDE